MTIQNDASGVNDLRPGGLNRMPASDAEFGLVDFLRIVRVRSRIILGVAATVVVLVVAVVLQLTPVYSATAVVLLDQRKNTVEGASAAIADIPSDPSTIQNQVAILTSTELAGRVVDSLHLENDPEFNADLGGWGGLTKYLNPARWIAGGSKTQADAQGINLERTHVIHALIDRLSVSQVGLSTAMSVTVKSIDPWKAAKIANAVANAYVNDQLEAKFQATQRATQWLSTRIAELSRQAQVADTAVQEYKAKYNITTTTSANGTGTVSVVDQQLANINNQLVLAKTDLAEKQANYGRLSALAMSGRASDAAMVLASPLIATLRAQETTLNGQIANLSSKYGPRHPKMIDLQAQKADLDAKIAEEVQRIVDSVKNEVGSARTRVASLEETLHQLESQSAQQNQAAVELTALQSAATSARAMYEAFLGRLNQTQGQQGIQTPDSRIISTAETPRAPSFPNKGLAIGISIPAGLILGLALALMLERLDNGFRTAQQVETMLGLPVLAAIPEIVASDKNSAVNAADFMLEKPLSSYSEAIRGLQLGFTLANLDAPPKIVLVTSSVPDEGKTTVSLSLARRVAASGKKVVLVDGDLRHYSLTKRFGRSIFKADLADALIEKHALHECLEKDPQSNCYILPCFQASANPADVLASHAMENLLQRLRREFDLVVIDSAPMLPVNDTRILSRIVDSVVFVIRWEKTPRDAAANALRLLMDTKVSISGIALARTNYERFRYYNYGYQDYFNYGKYYSD